MQKLVTVSLYSEKSNAVTEHIESYLTEGWKVVSVTPAVGGVGPAASFGYGGTADGYVYGWLAILLEKS